MYMERTQAPMPSPEHRHGESDEIVRRELGSRALAQCPKCGHELDLPPPDGEVLPASLLGKEADMSQVQPSTPRRTRIYGIPFSGGYKIKTRTRDELIEDRVRELSTGDMNQAERDRIRDMVRAGVDRNY
jgi:hypothetical protein